MPRGLSSRGLPIAVTLLWKLRGDLNPGLVFCRDASYQLDYGAAGRGDRTRTCNAFRQ